MPQDIEINCADCKYPFTLTAGEQDFFKSKGYQQPKRCQDCRWRRKQDALNQKDTGNQ